MMQPVLIGGLFIGVLSALPIVSLANYCCCCLWVIAGGVVASYLDQQNLPEPMTPARGARVGLFAGMIGAVVWLVVSQALDALFAPFIQRFAAEVLSNARDMPPEVREWLEEAAAMQGSRYVAGFALMLLAGAIFSTAGGLIGAIYFRKDVPPALGGPIPPPPLP